MPGKRRSTLRTDLRQIRSNDGYCRSSYQLGTWTIVGQSPQAAKRQPWKAGSGGAMESRRQPRGSDHNKGNISFTGIPSALGSGQIQIRKKTVGFKSEDSLTFGCFALLDRKTFASRKAFPGRAPSPMPSRDATDIACLCALGYGPGGGTVFRFGM